MRDLYRSYEHAGVRFDHSPVNFAVLSPAIDDLELERFGLRLRPPQVLYAARSADRQATFAPGPDAIAAELTRFSAADAARAGELLHGLREAAPALLATAFFTVEPDLAEATAATAEATGLAATDLAAWSGADSSRNCSRRMPRASC